jgi:hypothetical protein
MATLVKEGLCVLHQVAHNDRRAERVDQVLIIRVQHESSRHFAIETNDTSEIQLLRVRLWGLIGVRCAVGVGGGLDLSGTQSRLTE